MDFVDSKGWVGVLFLVIGLISSFLVGWRLASGIGNDFLRVLAIFIWLLNISFVVFGWYCLKRGEVLEYD